ncbi:hypothetical protein ED733_000835 [Metarhizium rileyi]|uniref:Heat-labile enterotoxin IIA, A chain n=1 Tax=Metarhizium rileyi (strain RCEF 4871) TaxID=1649241 RepID=A0A5C6G7E8_METRR|nr:hypothetical protein ED733_000835 [Metarhizium rileyi]
MKSTPFALLALAGLAIGKPADIEARNLPQPGSTSAKVLLELVVDGMKSWGLAGAVTSPSSDIKGPPRRISILPGPHRLTRVRKRPKKNGVQRTPGSPLGPRKKHGRIYARGKVCTSRKRGIKCPPGTVAAGGTSKYPRLRANGRGGTMVAFGMLSPYAHDILKAVEKWDNPVSKTVAWFEAGMSSIQEAIGGRNVPEIHGNELKLWLICLLRDSNPRYPDPVDKACRRRRDGPAEEQKQQQAIDGLNGVAELCEVAEQDPPADEGMRRKVAELCDKFADTLENMVDANAGMILLGEWSRAKTLNGGALEWSDVAAAIAFIDKGAFGAAAMNATEVDDLATMYLQAASAYAIIREEADGSGLIVDHDKPPLWTELLEIGASYIPEDRAAVSEALQLLEGTAHLREFDREGRDDLMAVHTCWTPESLLALQPRRWDRVLNAMIYLNDKLFETDSALACAPCQVRVSNFFVLRCGSALP